MLANGACSKGQNSENHRIFMIFNITKTKNKVASAPKPLYLPNESQFRLPNGAIRQHV